MEHQKGIVETAAEKIWKFFSSVKLAVVLLIILAIVSVIGTVIQQNEPTERYLQEYSPATVELFEMLGFFDMYHTWWFVMLLFFLTTNLIVCSLERFPRTWSVIKAPLKPLDDAGLKAVQFKQEIAFKGGMDKAEARASQVLKAHRYPAVVTSGPGVFHFAAQKGAYSRLGVYLTHTSIILIFVGALIGVFFGFKGFLNLPEGEASDRVYLRNEPMWDRIKDAMGVSKSRAVMDRRNGVLAMPIDFFVRLNDFEVDYYTNPQSGTPTGMPSEYWSNLSVFDLQGKKIEDKRIRVNDPLTFDGITFYQSSYGTMPGVPGKVVLSIHPKNREVPGETVIVDPGASAYVSSIDRTIKVLGVAPFALRDPATGRVMTMPTQNDEFVNPGVELEVFRGKTPVYRTIIMKTDPGHPYLPEDYVITYVDYWGARYTGLQVTKDPGVWIVYTGFVLLIAGPLVAFFGSHRKVWVRIQDRKGHAVVTVAGSANRNRLGFESECQRIADAIAK